MNGYFGNLAAVGLTAMMLGMSGCIIADRGPGYHDGDEHRDERRDEHRDCDRDRDRDHCEDRR